MFSEVGLKDQFTIICFKKSVIIGYVGILGQFYQTLNIFFGNSENDHPVNDKQVFQKVH